MKNIHLVLLLIYLFLMPSYSTKAQVTQEWVSTYSEPMYGYDVVSAMVIDASNNAYVTGWSYSNGSGYDFFTIKYNNFGEIQWTDRYNGTANREDLSRSIKIDELGNIFVTGSSEDIDSYNGIVTIKYNSSGARQWVLRYNYPGARWSSAIGAEVDGSGNVIVAGKYFSDTQWSNFLTIKYNSSGTLLWAASYDGTFHAADEPRAMTIDNLGNVYVTGNNYPAYTLSDFITIKYSSTGSELWVRSYNGPANDSDVAWCVSVDNQSNVFASGFSQGIGTAMDFATVKYDPSGVELWAARYDGPSHGEDFPISIKADNAGNLYVAGTSMGIGTDFDFAVVKYNSSGLQQWCSRYDNNSPGLQDGVTGLALDNSGNVYVTGVSANANQTDYNSNTIKYNSEGIEQWCARYCGPENLSDAATEIAVNGNGDVFLSGYTERSHTYYDYLTLKYVQGDFAQFRHSGLDEPIGDMSSAADTIRVNIYDLPPQFVVADINVIIDTVLHPNTGDLEFTLFHAGITDTLVYHAGGSGDNFILTILNDSAITSISNGSAPFSGSFRPYKPLSILNNNDATGDWILRVYDRSTGNTDTLNAWTLQLKFNSVIAIQPISNEIPVKCSLTQNYPNPFNPVTRIRYQVTGSGSVILKVYDILGKVAAVLVNEKQNPGTYEVQFDASRLASGQYFYRLETGEYTETRKMVLVK